MKLLLTGATGFVGQHVARKLPATPLNGPDGAPIDLADTPAITRAIAAAAPDAVLHLAAQSSVPASFSDPQTTFQTNVMGTLNLLTCLEQAGFRGRMVYVGSADIYGRVPEAALPVTEAQPARPRSPYAASKAAAELAAYQWGQTGTFEVVLARPFNHSGPGQDDRFVVPQLARQVAEIKLKKREPVVEVGDLAVTRDFTDVRDVVRAYALLLEKGRPGEVYNICSGEEVAISALLDQLFALAGVTPEIRADTQKYRPSEQRRMVGSSEKLTRETGWRPQIAITATLADTLAYWENELG